MNVLMTVDAVGGIYGYALTLAKGLERFGVEVHLATMGPLPTRQQIDEATTLSNVELHVSEHALEWMDDPWSDVEAAGEWLLSLEREIEPDIVHLNGFSHGSLPFRAPVVCVGHSCVLSWWRAVRQEEAPPRYDRYRTAVRTGLKSADVVVAPTQTMLSELERYYGPFQQSMVILNGADPVPSRVDEDPFFFAAGRAWDAAKNISLLDRVAGELEWPVLVAGSCASPTGEQIELRQARPLGELSRSEVRAWISRAPALIHPAIYEPFGLVPLEAAASGTALILAGIPSLREVWGDAALYFSPDKPGDLVAIALVVARDPALRRRLAERAEARARSLTTDRMARAYLELYGAIADPGALVHRARTRGR